MWSAPLQEACAARNLAVDDVLASLAAQAEQPAPSTDWNPASLAALIGHIVGTHHAYVKAVSFSNVMLNNCTGAGGGCATARLAPTDTKTAAIAAV